MRLARLWVVAIGIARWEVQCNGCGCNSKVKDNRPYSCPICGELEVPK